MGRDRARLNIQRARCVGKGQGSRMLEVVEEIGSWSSMGVGVVPWPF